MKNVVKWRILDRSTKAFPLAVIGLTAVFVVGLVGMVFLIKPKVVAVAQPSPSPVPTPSPSIMPSPIDATRDGGKLSTAIPNDIRIPILMYHYIRDYHNEKDKIGRNLSVSPAIFEKQLQTITDAGFQTITFNDLTDPVNLPAKPIIITLDDGYDDAYSAALPVLQKFEMNAVFYLVSSFLDKPGYVSSDQAKALDLAGMQIGAHAVEHKDLSKMSELEQRRQLSESKSVLEQLIGKPVLDFCYPSGKFNQATLNVLEQLGYRTATTVRDGIVPAGYWSAKPYELPRIRVGEGTDLAKELRSVQ